MKVTSLSRSQAAAKRPAAPFWELHGITQAHVLHWTKTKSWQWVLIGAHLAAVGLRCSRTVVGRTQPRNRKASIYKESAKWNTSTGAKLGQNCYVTGKDSAATFWWLYNIGLVCQNAPFPQGIPWDSRAQIPRKGDLSELPGAAHDCRMGAVRGLILAMFFPCLISLRLPFTKWISSQLLKRPAILIMAIFISVSLFTFTMCSPVWPPPPPRRYPR